jgi:hypothetical protein
MTEGLPPGPEEMDAAIKPVQDELFPALFAYARANEELRADVTVIALIDFAAQVAIASGMLWQDYPAPAHSSFSAALHDFANQLEAQRAAEPALPMIVTLRETLSRPTTFWNAKIPRATPNHHQPPSAGSPAACLA